MGNVLYFLLSKICYLKYNKAKVWERETSREGTAVAYKLLELKQGPVQALTTGREDTHRQQES